MEKLYIASNNLSSIDLEEVEIKSRTEHFFTRVNRKYKEAIRTQYTTAFSTKEEGYAYIAGRINDKIHSAKVSLKKYEDLLEQLKSKL